MADEVCAACEKSVKGEVLEALNKKWHPEHFTCAYCKKPIGTEQFHEKDGQVYCIEDFTQHFCPKCDECGKPISDKIIKAMGKTFHEDHWVCSCCKKPLGQATFMQRDNKPICQGCYVGKFAPRCANCSKPILEKTMIAFEKKWHPDCFTCMKCKNPIKDEKFKSTPDKKAVCIKCA